MTTKWLRLQTRMQQNYRKCDIPLKQAQAHVALCAVAARRPAQAAEGGSGQEKREPLKQPKAVAARRPAQAAEGGSGQEDIPIAVNQIKNRARNMAGRAGNA